MIRKGLSLLLVVGILLVSWVGVAAAQTPDEGDDGDLMARLAAELDMTREELLQTLLEGKTLREVAADQGVDPRDLMGRPHHRPSRGQVVDATRELLADVMADSLGMTPEELREALASGQTVPELLEAEGLDPEVVADRKSVV